MFGILFMLYALITGHVTTYDTGYGQAGVVVHVAPHRCVGYEFRGETGVFGNVFGLQGGDCN